MQRMMASLSGQYCSYLVRFWQSNEQGHWRASAQCIQSVNTLLFGTTEELLTFLQTEISAKRESRINTPQSNAEQP